MGPISAVPIITRAAVHTKMGEEGKEISSYQTSLLSQRIILPAMIKAVLRLAVATSIKQILTSRTAT